MTIAQGDIKFVASVTMNDVPEGGGAPSSHVIVDGLSNEIFDDISELDRAGGNVSLRKIFVAVETPTTDTYLDANVIVSEPPTDPNVSVTLFTTRSTFDTRDSARQRVEAYLAESTEWPGFLLENHIAGQRVLQIFQRTTEPAPNIGQTIVLIYREGLADERKQFVRVTDVSTVERTYTTVGATRTYQGLVVSAGISDALRVDFPGTSPNEYFTRGPAFTKIRETSVADAAVYCGVTRMITPANVGDLATQVLSVFTQLVPSAQTEIPLVDVNAAGTSIALTPAGDGTILYATSAVINSTTALSVGNPITPGTLVITIDSVTLTDTGGQLYDGATVVGVVDYARGNITFPSLAAPYNGSKTISYKASAAPQRIADTGQIAVTPESRSFNYIVTLLPTPAPGTVVVSYRAQGRWYDLRDNGGGVVRGSDASYGVGSVNYATGTIAMTLGVLPDVGSAVMYAWGTKVNYIDRSALSVAPSFVTTTLTNIPVLPGSLDITWDDGSAKTATDDGKGLITGNATGTIDYATGIVKLSPSTLPLGGQNYVFAYQKLSDVDKKTASFPTPSRNGNLSITLNLGATNVTPGTVKLTYAIDQPITVEDTSGRRRLEYTAGPRASAHDDGNGNMIGELSRAAGTINYTTGIVNLFPDGGVLARRDEYKTGVEYDIGYGGSW